MVIGLWLAAAHAAPVVCDPLAAGRLVAEARIDSRRAPISHAELIPGLALGASRTDHALRLALEELCQGEPTLSLVRGESWEGADWAAHTFLLTRSETRDCTLFQRTIAISVGVTSDTAPHYALRSRRPMTRTPVGDCETTPTWREEKTLAGEGGPVRVVLAIDREDDVVHHSEVLARTATPRGWREQVLLAPAPERLLSGGSGPTVSLTERFEEKWIVVHGDRVVGEDGACSARPGQTVWTPDDGRYTPHTGRDALGLLARRGLWRMAGDDGWMLVMATEQEDEYPEILAQRERRIQRRSADPVHVLPSSWFPGLNPGFMVFTPSPWPTARQAEDARTRWRSWRRAYVKKAWDAPDPCD